MSLFVSDDEFSDGLFNIDPFLTQTKKVKSLLNELSNILCVAVKNGHHQKQVYVGVVVCLTFHFSLIYTVEDQLVRKSSKAPQ